VHACAAQGSGGLDKHEGPKVLCLGSAAMKNNVSPILATLMQFLPSTAACGLVTRRMP